MSARATVIRERYERLIEVADEHRANDAAYERASRLGLVTELGPAIAAVNRSAAELIDIALQQTPDFDPSSGEL
jgi:hypothetical protein